jgi:tripartite-type tricarboxylate transporter receptor subunit TctC
VQRLNRAMLVTLQASSVQERLREIGSDLVSPERGTPDYLGRFVATEIEKWARVIKASGIQFE